MQTQIMTLQCIRNALFEGWRVANETRGVSIIYSGVFVFGGVFIIGGLLVLGWAPFVIAAAGAFMLLGPAILAGYFGVASVWERGLLPRFADVIDGFANASSAIWALALVCGLLFMIFVTDAAILYAYMVGNAPVWLSELPPLSESVSRFVVWSAVSGAIVAFLLYAISAFAVPLLCERRADLVEAVVVSVKVVFGNFAVAMLWALLISTLVIASVVILPLLPLVLPWLAYASRALYREVLPV
jgi:uncharacterized membrane protein